MISSIGLLASPLAAPPQVRKKFSAFGTADNRTVEPKGYGPELGSKTMLPLPRTLVVTGRPNTAWIDLGRSIVTARGVVVPLTSPLQCMKVHPVSGVAVRFTTELGAYSP